MDTYTRTYSQDRDLNPNLRAIEARESNSFIPPTETLKIFPLKLIVHGHTVDLNASYETYVDEFFQGPDFKRPAESGFVFIPTLEFRLGRLPNGSSPLSSETFRALNTAGLDASYLAVVLQDKTPQVIENVIRLVPKADGSGKYYFTPQSLKSGLDLLPHARICSSSTAHDAFEFFLKLEVSLAASRILQDFQRAPNQNLFASFWRGPLTRRFAPDKIHDVFLELAETGDISNLASSAKTILAGFTESKDGGRNWWTQGEVRESIERFLSQFTQLISPTSQETSPEHCLENKPG